jgi:hypothetical protein
MLEHHEKCPVRCTSAAPASFQGFSASPPTGPFDSPTGQILVRQRAERLLECTKKMERAELRQLSQSQ